MKHQQDIILFLCHHLNDSVLQQFDALKQTCSQDYSVKMLYDNSRDDFDSSLFNNESEYFLFQVHRLAEQYPFMNPHKPALVPGNNVFAILYFAEKQPDFRFLWIREYDTRFTGNWRTLFDFFAENNSDLLGTTLFRYSFRPSWNWWKSLKTPVPLDPDSYIRGFLPVMRLSKKGCDILAASYRSGWSGHFEVVIPTALSFHGCPIEDIGGDGEFVKAGNVRRFYTNTPSAPGLAPGTFVCPPHVCEHPDKPNKLYHPVKK